MKSQFEKNCVLLIEEFSSLVQPRNVVKLHHIIQCLLYYLSSGRLREVKSKGKFQTFTSKSDLGLLREVVAHMRFDLITILFFEKKKIRKAL